MTLETKTIRQMNQLIISEDKVYQRVIQEMRDVEKFVIRFGELSFCRDIVVCKNKHFSLQRISTALELTVGSIISCCEAGCIADAYSLLRKY